MAEAEFVAAAQDTLIVARERSTVEECSIAAVQVGNVDEFPFAHNPGVLARYAQVPGVEGVQIYVWPWVTGLLADTANDKAMRDRQYHHNTVNFEGNWSLIFDKDGADRHTLWRGRSLRLACQFRRLDAFRKQHTAVRTRK